MLRIVLLFAAAALAQPPDPRLITTGHIIPDEFYADQPYIVKTNDGAWLCVITTGPGAEGAGGQHVVSFRSTDQGKTWEQAVDIEPNTGPEASYAVTLKANNGRVYVFYNHNTDNVRQVIADNPPYKDGFNRRVDSLGHFVFKYTDDNGKSWSPKRYDIPQRDFEIDRQNPYQGKLKFFWTVGKAFVYKGAAMVPLHKVGGFGQGFFTRSEGVLLRSANLLTESDPNRITWETLPDGDIGIRAPAGGGPIAEEQSFSVMSDGSIFCVFRTVDGHPAHTYSRDGGRTWEPTRYMRYADGRLMKHPRAANFAWRAANGKYLYWFHNHGGRSYDDRNPVWLSGGVEADGPNGKVVLWSQPEIVLYDDDPIVRMSYPDLIEEDGKYFLTETQKDVARVHEISPALLAGLWGAVEAPSAPANPVFRPFFQRSNRADHSKEDLRTGFTLELSLANPQPGDVLLSAAGLTLKMLENNRVEITLNDGRTENRWTSDARPDALKHLVAIVDGGPKVICFLTNGQFNDGGPARQFGWGRFSPNLMNVPGLSAIRANPSVSRVQTFPRALRTAEAVALYKSASIR
jgi:hypothetical protein